MRLSTKFATRKVTTTRTSHSRKLMYLKNSRMKKKISNTMAAIPIRFLFLRVGSGVVMLASLSFDDGYRH